MFHTSFRGEDMSKSAKDMFKVKYKGYEIRSVDQFVFTNTKELEDTKNKLTEVEATLKELTEKYEALSKEHETLKNEIEGREKAADEISRIALKEANVIVETANRNADSIVKESLATARQILIEMSNLGNEAIFLKKHVKERMDRLAVVIDQFTLPNIPSLDCLDLVDENEDEDKTIS